MPLNPSSLRTLVARFLVDTCTITTRGGVAFDADEGIDVETAGTTVYAGVCRIRPAGGDQTVIVGESPVPYRTHDVWLPWDTTGVEVNHLLTLDTCDDPHMVDRTFTVTDVQGGSSGPHRKLGVVERLTADEAPDEEEGS